MDHTRTYRLARWCTLLALFAACDDTAAPSIPDADTSADTDSSGPDAPDTTTPDTHTPDTHTPDADSSGPDAPDVTAPCAPPSLCACPTLKPVLVFDLDSDRRLGRAAVEHLGCQLVVASRADFAQELASGAYDLVLMELPDTPPEGAWTQALLDHISRGGAAVVAGQRLDQAPAPSLPATFGATWGPERKAPVPLTPTWTVPLYSTPNALRRAGFTPDTASTWAWNGAPLTATAGRVWARGPDGAATVQSNGGRTFLNGFLFDSYPHDTDDDGVPDMVELIANQLALAAEHLEAPPAGPVLDNFATADTVRYELPILRGAAHNATEIHVHSGPRTHSYPVAGGRFKALILLQRGENWVTLEATRDGRPTYTHLELDYLPQTTSHKVRLVYAVASDGDGTFQAPFGEPNDLASAKRRLALAGRLLQALLADRVHAGGLGRNTFELVRDVSHEPEVFVWHTTATTAEWHAMEGGQIWSRLYSNLGQLPACTSCKTLLVLGMTHYDAATDQVRAHTALGGGDLAIFGSATLHTFPEDLDQLVTRLEDTRDITTLQPRLFDDSGYRRSMWANFATGLGALLHELAHAMNAPHAAQGNDILNRGFDHVNRLLMAREPASAVTPGLPEVLPQDEPIFALSNLGRLRWHRYSAIDLRTYSVNTTPQATVVGDEVRIATNAGLRSIGYARDVDGDWQIASGALLTAEAAPTTYTVPKSSLSLLFPDEARIRLFLTDDQGNHNDALIVTLP